MDKYLVTVRSYDNTTTIGFFTINLLPKEVKKILCILHDDDMHLCFSCYDQGEYRISGFLHGFTPVSQNYPAEIHRESIDSDLHIHDDLSVKVKVASIKDGVLHIVHVV
jgi:hypothetical protein